MKDFNNINTKLSKDRCTGCSVCQYSCPKGAIRFTDECDGFMYPIVDKSSCVDCGLCLKVCPSTVESRKKELQGTQVAYAVQADDAIRSRSSSGGVFRVVAEYILENKGYVCGSAFIKGKEKHIIVSSIDDLEKLQTSKYIQSDMTEVWSQLAEAIKTQRLLLFVGTPCQCAAVKCIFKNCHNLVIMDLLCMGVPSQNLFDRYIKENFDVEKLEYVNFRDKTLGWSFKLFFSLQTGEKSYILNCFESSYFLAFLKEMSIRESCIDCQYSRKERIGDITIGDFWGIGGFNPEFDDGKGTSFVMINNRLGEKIFDSVQDRFCLFEEAPILQSQKNNLSPKHIRGGKRKEFFEGIKTSSINATVQKLVSEIADVGIINYWYTNDHGAILTAYALQQLLKDNGITSRLINVCPDVYIEERRQGISEQFEYKYLYSTDIHNKNLKLLNQCFKTFAVGSDQVFRAEWVPNTWFLSFANRRKNKIAIAASYGTDRLNISWFRKMQVGACIKRFQSISVREKNGIEITRQLGKKATWILDPVFLVDRSKYEQFVNADQSDYIFCYIRDNNEAFQIEVQKFAYEINMRIVFVHESMPVEEFLDRIANSKFVITDSYHGLCFSIIFNRNFICIVNKKRGKERFESLIEKLELPQNHFFDKKTDVHCENIINSYKDKIDFKEIIRNIENYQKKDIDWIVDAINQDVELKVSEMFFEVYFSVIIFIQKVSSKIRRITCKKLIKRSGNRKEGVV